MDKTIVTGFLIVVSVVASLLLFNSLYPAILQSNDAMIAMKTRLDNRLKSQVVIVHASGELDSSGSWQDTNGDGNFDIFAWTKNVGSNRISAIERADVFFGPEGNFTRIPHQSTAGGVMPYWTYTIENDTVWNPTATLAIEIHHSSTLSSGRYYFKFVSPDGIEDELMFAI